MAYWNWDSSLDIGVDIIDSQHRRIVDYINELHDARETGDRTLVGEVIQGLMDYTVSHFAFEEELQKKAGYMLSSSHKQVHEAFVARVSRYQDRHNKGEDVARQLLSDLHLWLANHIKHDDKDYVPVVKKMTDGGWVKRALGKMFG